MAKIEELEPLLTAPAEALNVEYKTWLDLKGNDEHKANFAKAAIAIAMKVSVTPSTPSASSHV